MEHGLNLIQILKENILKQKDGNDIFIYWDLDATPNQNGNRWRNATNPSVRVA